MIQHLQKYSKVLYIAIAATIGLIVLLYITTFAIAQMAKNDPGPSAGSAAIVPAILFGSLIPLLFVVLLGASLGMFFQGLQLIRRVRADGPFASYRALVIRSIVVAVVMLVLLFLVVRMFYLR